MASEGLNFLALEVPQFGGFVVTTGEYELAIRGESNGVDEGEGVQVAAGKGLNFLALEVP